MRNYYLPGQWNTICDRCGLKKKSGMLRKEWTGLMVCADTCWEERHPQTLIRVPEDNPSIEWARPESADQFVGVSSPITTEAGTNSDYFILTESGVIINTEVQ